VSLVFQYRMRCLHWCDRLGVQPDGGVRMLQYRIRCLHSFVRTGKRVPAAVPRVPVPYAMSSFV